MSSMHATPDTSNTETAELDNSPEALLESSEIDQSTQVVNPTISREPHEDGSVGQRSIDISQQAIDKRPSQHDVLTATSDANTVEEFYATVDFGVNAPNFDSVNEYTILGIETENPIIQIGAAVYRGTWTEIIGTEMVFNRKGENVVNLRKRLMCERVNIKKKGGSETRPAFIRAMPPPVTDDESIIDRGEGEGLVKGNTGHKGQARNDEMNDTPMIDG